MENKKRKNEKETEDENEEPAEKHKGPVKRFFSMPLEVTVWENEGKEGRIYNTVKLEKVYKKNDDWKKTTSMNANDLPKAVMLMQKAFEFLQIDEA